MIKRSKRWMRILILLLMHRTKDMFRRTIQEDDETIYQFVTRLRQKALSCEYGDSSDEFIQVQVIDQVIAQLHFVENCLKGDKL